MGGPENIKDNLSLSHADLNTVDFVLSVLDQHEKEFGRLVSKLKEVTAQLREADNVAFRIEAIDDKLELLRSEISNLAKCRPVEK